MRRTWLPSIKAGLLLVAAVGRAGVPAVLVAQAPVYQTDLRILSMDVVVAGSALKARAVVIAEPLGEARGVQVEFLLPAGVGLLETAAGCSAGPSPPGVSSLRARVVCQLGTLAEGGTREVFVKTTFPPTGVERTFAAFARSDTPDVKPGNNYAERTLPR